MYGVKEIRFYQGVSRAYASVWSSLLSPDRRRREDVVLSLGTSTMERTHLRAVFRCETYLGFGPAGSQPVHDMLKGGRPELGGAILYVTQ